MVADVIHCSFHGAVHVDAVPVSYSVAMNQTMGVQQYSGVGMAQQYPSLMVPPGQTLHQQQNMMGFAQQQQQQQQQQEKLQQYQQQFQQFPNSLSGGESSLQQQNQQSIANAQLAMLQTLYWQQAQQQQAQQQQAQQQQAQQQLHLQQISNLMASNVSSTAQGPPAKRRAVDLHPIIRQRLDQFAAERMKLLIDQGRLSHIDAKDHPKVLHRIRTEVYSRYMASVNNMGMLAQQQLHNLGGANAKIQPARTTMRVMVDKSNRLAADKLVNAEEMAEKDHADEVMRRCEEISRKLKQHIGKKGDGVWEGQHVTLDKLIEACGDTAKYLKPYQVVGVNFLNTLYTASVGGGKVL